MKKQKLFRVMLRILGVSIMGLGLLISNIPMDGTQAATAIINEIPDTGGTFEALLAEGDGELILGGLVTDIKRTPDKDPANPYAGASTDQKDKDTFGPLWQSRLKSITLSPSMLRVDRYTISDKVDDPNVYEEFDNVKNVVITIPSNIVDIEKNAIMCFGANRIFTIRSYPTQLTGLTVNPNITSPSVAKRYVDEYNLEHGGQKMVFEAIPTDIQYKTKDNPLNVDITKVKAQFVRAGYVVNGPLDLHVNTRASDLVKIEGIPEVPTESIRLYYDITLRDNIFNSTVTKTDFPFDTAELTIPVPASVDLSKYKIDKIYTTDAENKLEQITDFSSNLVAKTVTFKTTHLSTFAFEYTLIKSRPSSVSMPGANMVVSIDGDYTYSIVQKEASNIPTTAGVPAVVKDGKRMYYEITLTNSAKQSVTDFGTASIKIPLPSDISLDKYKLNQVYTIDSKGKYERIKNAIISTDTTVSPLVNYINFSTNHFSEFVVEFAPLEDNTNNNDNTQNNNTNNNQENNNQENNNQDNNQEGNQDNNNETPNETPPENNDEPENNTPDNNNNNQENNNNNNNNATNNNTNNNANNNNGGTNNNAGNTNNETPNNTTGTNTNNTVDMPPTADMTSVRSIAVIMMFLLGGVMLLLSVGPLKPKKAV